MIVSARMMPSVWVMAASSEIVEPVIVVVAPSDDTGLAAALAAAPVAAPTPAGPSATSTREVSSSIWTARCTDRGATSPATAALPADRWSAMSPGAEPPCVSRGSAAPTMGVAASSSACGAACDGRSSSRSWAAPPWRA